MGTLQSSKSLMNRLLIAKSYFPNLVIHGKSNCDDVKLMQAGLAVLQSGDETVIECGHAGTVLRFLALRASRVPGEHILVGSERLFSRPMNELLTTIRQLGVEAEVDKRSLRIFTEGWKPSGDAVHINSLRSSQFATALLINSWQLKQQIAISPGRKVASPLYWQMSLRLMESLGMKIERWEESYVVFPHQSIKIQEFYCELDMSSAFAIASTAVLCGQAIVLNFPSLSLQPDSVFVETLQKMGAVVTLHENRIHFSKSEQLKPIEFDLDQAPDMFPVLAVVCAFAAGKSRLYGACQLEHKESKRITKVRELLKKMGRNIEDIEGGLIVYGNPEVHSELIDFDCDEDHRLAMAAGVALKLGFNMSLVGHQCVSKSFPEFWDIMGTNGQ